MRKLLETSLGNNGDTWFSLDGKRVSEEDALNLIKKKSNPYDTDENNGVVVYMSEEEYKSLDTKKISEKREGYKCINYGSRGDCKTCDEFGRNYENRVDINNCYKTDEREFK
jgi:hypothetical protein